MTRAVTIFALVLLVRPFLVLAQTPDADLQRAVQGVTKIKRCLKNPDNLVIDSVALAQGKHGSNVCYSFHSKSAFDFVGRTFTSTGGLEVKTAALDWENKIHFGNGASGRHWLAQCLRQDVADITEQVREAGSSNH
jgi:hypothetical protein